MSKMICRSNFDLCNYQHARGDTVVIVQLGTLCFVDVQNCYHNISGIDLYCQLQHQS